MPTKLNHDILTAAIEGFEVQKKRLDAQIAELRQLMTGGKAEHVDATPKPAGQRRKMSAAGRKRIAEAQRKRWAAIKDPGVVAKTAKPVAKTAKRKLSAEGRQRIIDATKKRWAAVRAAARK